MRILRAILCALISLGAAACSNDRDVTDVQFGSFSGVGTGKVRFQATTTLSKKEGLHLGWLFSVRSHPGQVVTVQGTVEGPPGTAWEAPPSASEVQVTDGGRTATVTRVFSDPRSPFAFHNWSLSESDPVGRGRATLVVNGQKIREVEFDVID